MGLVPSPKYFPEKGQILSWFMLAMEARLLFWMAEAEGISPDLETILCSQWPLAGKSAKVHYMVYESKTTTTKNPASVNDFVNNVLWIWGKTSQRGFYSICKRNLLNSLSFLESSKKCSDCCWLINTVNEMLINHQQFSLTITWIDHID